MASRPGSRARHRPAVGPYAAIVVLSCAGAASGCGSGSVQWHRPVTAAAGPSAGPLFVMEPLVEGAVSPGNVGRNLPRVRRDVLERILAIVRERIPARAVLEPPPVSAGLDLPGYRVALAGEPALPEELAAARLAYEGGGTNLLVATITEWREMRTDDPFGAVIGPHPSISLRLRLMALRPPAVVGQVTFSNRARLTLNRSAEGLLNDRFRKAVLELVSSIGDVASARAQHPRAAISREAP